MLADVARRFGAGCAVWIARLEGEPVAAIIILHFGAYAKYWRGAMNKELAAPVRANDLLQRLAIEDACSSGYRYYDMGGSRAGSPLATFKERFGGEAQVAHDLRMERIPLEAGAALSRRLIKRLMRFQDA
jgi:lipid II:glycine glycyltransferase (peptidoglycan interpeptide bridge formation enzyme)